MFYPSSMPSFSHLLSSADRPPSPASSSSSSSASLPQQQLCPSWEQGRCLRGTQCKYLHLGAPSSAPSPASSTPASLIASNTYSGFPTSTSASQLYSLHSSSPSPPSAHSHSPTPPHPSFALSLADLDDYPLDGGKPAALRRPMQGMPGMQGLTNRMAGLGFHSGMGMSGGPMGGQRKECWDWLAGRCQRGTMCKYMHAGMGGMAGGSGGMMNGNNGNSAGGGGGGINDNVCHQWARAGQCQYGDVCKFAHISSFPLPSHSQRPSMSQQTNGDFTDDDGYLPPHASSMLPPHSASSPSGSQHQHGQFPYMSNAAAAPPILFRDTRLGLDTEVCRFYAKHSRCKYSNACKFVHVHHGGAGGGGGVQVSGVMVTIAELQRLCALHGPGGIVSMGGGGMGAGMSGMGNNGGSHMGGKIGGMGTGGGVLGGYDKKAVLALEKEVRELRELKELHDREQRSQAAQQQLSPAERFNPLLSSNSFSSTFSTASSSSSPIPQSSPAFSFASTSTNHLNTSNKSTPPLGGGLGGSFSPSLLHLNSSSRSSTTPSDSTGAGTNKAVGSPLVFPSTTAGFGSFQLLGSAEMSPPDSGAGASGISTSSLFYSSSVPRSSFHSSTASAADLAAVDADEDNQLIAGSTYAALSGSGALLKGRVSAGGDGVGASSGGVMCDHCGMNGSVWRDSYSSLCDECHTSLLR